MCIRDRLWSGYTGRYGVRALCTSNIRRLSSCNGYPMVLLQRPPRIPSRTLGGYCGSAGECVDVLKKMQQDKGEKFLQAFFDLLAQDYIEDAVKSLRKAVKEGNLRAMWWMGLLYYDCL